MSGARSNDSQTDRPANPLGPPSPPGAERFADSAINRLADAVAEVGAPTNVSGAPTEADDRAPAAARPRTVDQYQLLSELGKGGMGVVWLAHDTLLDRQVAIKVLAPGLHGSASVRLLREAKAAAGLNHPNTISIFHVLEQRRQLYIVMELLGGSLDDELRALGALPWLQATTAIRGAAAGLSAAHQAGLVHRDVKPSNLLRAAHGVVKVADFGLVYTSDTTQLTAAGMTPGTPQYMSPEQCRGEQADARSDVYSLGCTYYCLLTGRPPFEGASAGEVRSRHLNDPFPDARQLVPDVPDGVCRVIETACRKDARLRYENASQMLADIEAVIAPPEPRRPPLATGTKVRIFISSPGDVAEERVLANNLVRRLSDEYANRLWIEPVFWEHEPLLAHDTFQSQIPRPSECEIVVCILWSRLGTRLPAAIMRADGTPYASGTEYEFEDAIQGRKNNGYPDLLVYRKTATPMVDLGDETALLSKLGQKKALDNFIQKWFFHGEDGTLKAAFHTFQEGGSFEQLLDVHLRKLIARRLPADAGSAPAAKPSWTKGSPFRGLQVFDFEHAPIFFGRTQAIGGLLTALRASAAAGRAFVLVVGVSGGGKSSLVRAGLLPLLVQPGVVEGVGLWRRAVMRPADAGDPMRSLAASLLAADALPELGADGTTAAQLADHMRQNPAAAAGLVKGALSQAAASFARERGLAQQPDARLVLVADQLEELFTLQDLTPADRQAFIAVLSALARGGKAWVVATLRGDFYHRCLELPRLVALKEGTGQFDLLLPTPAEIGQMIRNPARAAGLSFEEDPATKAPLDEGLREAAASSPESLPLLEFALEQLYQRKTPAGLLTYAAYRELGGVEGALAQRAEAVYASMPSEVQATLPRVMRALVSVSAGDAVTRQQATLEGVARTPAAKVLVDAFVQARLFSADRAEQGQAAGGERSRAVVRVAHEALLRNWPRVVQSLERDKSLLIVRARVSAAAARWIADGKPGDLLLGQGKPLAEAEHLAAVLGDELAPADRALIAASRARKTRRRVILAAVLVVMIAMGLVIRWKVVEQQKATTAAGLVRQVINADTAQVPSIVGEIDRYRQWADPLLRQENGSAAADSRSNLRTSLALLAVDPGQVDFLYGRLLTAKPDEVSVIRDALLPHKDALIGKLWSAVQPPEKDKGPARLRAAAALAKYDPGGKKWDERSGWVVNDLVEESPVFFAQWSEAFQPVRHHLLAALKTVFHDTESEHAAERNLATNLLVVYFADDPPVLADLLMDGDEKQFAVIYPKFMAQAEKGLPVLIGEVDKKLSDAKVADRETLAKRQANAAVALLRLGEPAKVWPLLKHSKDPRARSYLIHRLGPLGADPGAIVRRLDEEPDITIRRALILSLGEFDQWKPPEQTALTGKLLTLYEKDPDPGLHAASEWLLRKWGQDVKLKAIDVRLRTTEGQLHKALSSPPVPAIESALPRWYVNGQGQTMVVVPGPVGFTMGLPLTEASRQDNETPHKVRIGRTFAVASKSVTVGEYARFAENPGVPAMFTNKPDLPVVGVDWYSAAAYCNWLSKQEGIPQDQWCYETVSEGVAKLKEGYLGLEGYRLPTEAEMEYATRAGALTSRYYGEADGLLPKYAWYLTNSQEKTWPVGSKKPNDLGLFDVHGNVFCWCQDAFSAYPNTQEGDATADEEHDLNVMSTVGRVLRGGSFSFQASVVRCAFRSDDVPSFRSVLNGFRAARTLRLGSFTSLPLPP